MRTILLSLALTLLCAATGLGQGGRGAVAAGSKHIVFGDVKIAQGPSDKSITLDFILYNEYGNEIANQRVQSNGRYRFIDISDGRYYIVIQYEGAEARSLHR